MKVTTTLTSELKADGEVETLIAIEGETEMPEEVGMACAYAAVQALAEHIETNFPGLAARVRWKEEE